MLVGFYVKNCMFVHMTDKIFPVTGTSSEIPVPHCPPPKCRCKNRPCRLQLFSRVANGAERERDFVGNPLGRGRGTHDVGSEWLRILYAYLVHAVVSSCWGQPTASVVNVASSMSDLLSTDWRHGDYHVTSIVTMWKTTVVFTSAAEQDE